jgi:hypothetical protein
MCIVGTRRYWNQLLKYFLTVVNLVGVPEWIIQFKIDGTPHVYAVLWIPRLRFGFGFWSLKVSVYLVTFPQLLSIGYVMYMDARVVL